MDKRDETLLDSQLHETYKRFIEKHMTLVTHATIESKPRIISNGSTIRFEPGDILTVPEHVFQGVKCNVCGAILTCAEDVINHVLRDHVRDINTP